MPGWFEAALLTSPQAMKNWAALIPSRMKEILRYLSRLRSPEARDRNLENALHVLSGRKRPFEKVRADTNAV